MGWPNWKFTPIQQKLSPPVTVKTFCRPSEVVSSRSCFCRSLFDAGSRVTLGSSRAAKSSISLPQFCLGLACLPCLSNYEKAPRAAESSEQADVADLLHGVSWRERRHHSAQNGHTDRGQSEHDIQFQARNGNTILMIERYTIKFSPVVSQKELEKPSQEGIERNSRTSTSRTSASNSSAITRICVLSMISSNTRAILKELRAIHVGTLVFRID